MENNNSNISEDELIDEEVINTVFIPQIHVSKIDDQLP